MHGFVAQIAEARPIERLNRLARAGWRTDAKFNCATIGMASCQPLIRSGTEAHLIGLAWLANRDEICDGLGLDAKASHLQDFDLIARLWERDGSAFVHQVNGGFSLLVYQPETGVVDCFRDPFGMFPLYYTQQAEHLTCGSDLRAVLHLANAPLTADLTRLADYIVGEEIDRSRTAFAEVRRVPAAHILRVDGQNVPELQAYWSLPDPAEISVEAAVSGFKAPLQLACSACVGAAPDGVGAMLSGGLDSSSVAGLAADQRAQAGAAKLPTLSFTYPGKPYDESPYITAADAQFYTDPEHIAVTAAPDLRALPGIVEEQMDLFLAYGLQKSRAIYHVGRDRGLGVLLDGHGGDEVVSHGYGRLIELAAARQWGALLRESRGVSQVYGSSTLQLFLLLFGKFARLKPKGLPRRAIMRLARRLHQKEQRGEPEFDSKTLLSDDLRAWLSLDETPRYGCTEKNGDTPAELRQQERFEHRRNLKAPILEHAFEVLFRAAGAACILPLYPFFDQRVVRFCLSVPADAKLQGGRTRWVLREGLGDVLPALIRNRSTKADFGDEFRDAVQRFAQATPIGHSLQTGARPIDLLRPESVAELEYRVGELQHSSADVLRAYWRLTVLRDWLDACARWTKLQAAGKLM
ncbi:asparagine synthase-related protein [Epibacterium ulvae]|uniref:asparagine synthase-related protein n=1 Tax=Epibacterium ulvae TaxID=1156985 RepID=UPI0024919543|nr:asparagine synthase-related protein [Epibacterium ulvae]